MVTGVGYPRGQVRTDLPGARIGHQLGHVFPRRKGELGLGLTFGLEHTPVAN